MTIDVRDHKFDHLRGLSATDRESEKRKLAAKGLEIFERAGDVMDDEAERAVSDVEQQLEFIKHVGEQESRIRSLYNAGNVEESAGNSPFNVPGTKPKPKALEGQQILSREQSVEQWSRDNGYLTTDSDEVPNFGKYLRGISTGDWRGAELERAMSVGTATAGGHTVPNPLSNKIIDLARAATQVIAAGATTVPMTSTTLKIPRLTGEGQPAWRNENAAVTAGDLAFDAVTLTARSLDRLVIVSRELVEDSDPAASQIIAQSFAAQIALELDRVALMGSGTPPEPRGVLNTSGITTTTHTANGAALGNYDFFLDAAGAVLANGYSPNAHIVAPRTVTSLGKLKDTQQNYLAAPTTMLPMLVTKQVPVNLTVGTSTDASYVFTGQWNMLAIGMRTGFELRTLTERYADNQQIGFLAHLRADVAVLQPAAFVVDTGVRG
jgi:HK97 family phage major capsid protein